MEALRDCQEWHQFDLFKISGKWNDKRKLQIAQHIQPWDLRAYLYERYPTWRSCHVLVPESLYGYPMLLIAKDDQ